MIFFGRLMLLGLVALGMSACGRRGALEPPVDASVAATAEPVATPGITVAGPLKGRKKRVPITPPNTPFFLDPIL